MDLDHQNVFCFSFQTSAFACPIVDLKVALQMKLQEEAVAGELCSLTILCPRDLTEQGDSQCKCPSVAFGGSVQSHGKGW